jgi:hypothetical protein
LNDEKEKNTNNPESDHSAKPEHMLISLTANNAVDRDMNEPPSAKKMGGEPDISKGEISLRIGYRPQARNLRLLYEKAGKQMPPDFEVYSAYDLWLLTHTVGIVDNEFVRKVRQFGYKVWFPDDMNNGKRITVVKALPETRFIQNVGGRLETVADLELSGSAEAPTQLTELLEQVEGLSANAKISLSTKANFVGRISFGLLTTAVNAVGEGDSYTEWVFHRVERPLIGTQVMMQVLRTPRRMRGLEFISQVYATIGVWSSQANKLASNLVRLEAELL